MKKHGKNKVSKTVTTIFSCKDIYFFSMNRMNIKNSLLYECTFLLNFHAGAFRKMRGGQAHCLFLLNNF